MPGDFRIRFWGVRGSIPCPGPNTLRYGGETACVEVRCGPHLLILDAGSGIRELGGALLQNPADDTIEADLFFTHTHHDHVIGLPFFRPAYDPRNRIRVYAGHLAPEGTIRQTLDALMSPPLFPIGLSALRGIREFNDFQSGETIEPRPGLSVRTIALNHPNQACGYRIDYGGRSFCYLTDMEHGEAVYDAPLLEFARGADVMVYDATFTDDEFVAGWGHSTWREACRVAAAAGVGRAVLFHHDPRHDDDFMDRIAEQANAVREGTLVARDGMVLEL
jgi:phosphoribosyl 1,2-cyclic phosphodiesterase